MLRKIRNSIVIVLLLALASCSGSLSRLGPEHKTCSAHYQDKIVAQITTDGVTLPSVTFVYGKEVPPSVSSEVQCLLLEASKSLSTSQVAVINFFNTHTKAMVQAVLDREAGVFMSQQFSISPEPDKIVVLVVILFPLDEVLKSFAGDENAFVLPLKEGQGMITLQEYKDFIIKVSGGKLTF